jgi:thioredoxin reductase
MMMEMQMKTINYHQIIILGCGPSSLSAAIQLKRSNIPFLMISEEMGGLIQNANFIENLLGFPNGISGREMIIIMQEFIQNYQIPIIYDKVVDIQIKEDNYWIRTTHELKFNCEYLIIGTGTIPNHLNVPGEIEAHSKNLLYYDIYKFESTKEKMRIGIIGSGDAAYDYALNLGKKNREIEILHRTESSKALPLLIHRVTNTSNIKITSSIIVREIQNSDGRLLLKCESAKRIKDKIYDILFVTIGRSPNISFLSPELKELFLNGKESEYQSKKIWFIGDVKNKKYRQLAIAMGDGVKVAMQISTMFHK